MTVITDDFQQENFSVLLSWMDQDTAQINTYTVSVNNATLTITNSTTTLLLEGHYNLSLEISLTASNCAGSSQQITLLVKEGEQVYERLLESVFNIVCVR